MCMAMLRMPQVRGDIQHCMVMFRVPQVRGGGEEEQHFMAKFRVPQVRGGFTTFV